jgi:hypothetical protein
VIPVAPKGVTADLNFHSELGRAALAHAVRFDPMHGPTVELPGLAARGAEERTLWFVANAGGVPIAPLM